MDSTPQEMFLDSKLAGAAFRGLMKSEVEQPENGFKYANCLEREYSTSPCNVNSVKFNISRYGKFKETLTFNPAVSEKEAIEAVETYLSQPLTEEYFDRIKSDMFHDYLSWEKAQEDYYCRGDCLTDSKFLERVYLKDGEMTFFIGS